MPYDAATRRKTRLLESAMRMRCPLNGGVEGRLDNIDSVRIRDADALSPQLD